MNTAVAQQLEYDELVRLLSQTHVSRAGKEFRPIDEVWKLNSQDRSHTRLGVVEEPISIEARPYFRLALARYASLNSADTVYNLIDYTRMIARSNDQLTDFLDPLQFISLKAKVGPEREYQLSVIRGFFRYWHISGLWGVSDEFIVATDKLTFRSNEKGRAVRDCCPIEGAYTPIEMQGIITGINNAYGNRELGITNYLLTRLLAERGVRRRQASELVFDDFYKASGNFKVRMPRGKQPGVDYREAFTTFEISEDLYHAAMLQKDHVIEHLVATQSDIVSVADHLPVFPRFAQFRLHPVRSARDITPDHHATRKSLAERLKRTERVIGVHSERTGMPLNLNSVRFRRTLGTDLYREGYGVAVIATALDHNDHQNAGVYTETSAELASRLDMRIGKSLAPMAQAFAGVIVKSEESAIRGNDPTSRIRTEDGEESIGNCGEMGFCGAHAPVACYTCVKFQPWLDASHEDVLAQLYEEREETLAMTGDETIAGVLDRQILAVEDVIHRCEEMRRKKEPGIVAAERENG